jgi:hypothetical protein
VEFQDDELVLEDGNPEPLWELSDGEAEDHDGDSSSGDEKTDADVCDDDDLGNDMEDGTNHGDGAAPAAIPTASVVAHPCQLSKPESLLLALLK